MSPRWNRDIEKTDELSAASYQGRPRKEGEEGKWNQFLAWLFPWFVAKRQLGDEFLKTEVELKQAEVQLKYTESLLNISEAKLRTAKAEHLAAQTAEKTAQLEDVKTKQTINVENADEKNELLQNKLKELEEKIYRLRYMHGGRIILVDDERSEHDDSDLSNESDL